MIDKKITHLISTQKQAALLCSLTKVNSITYQEYEHGGTDQLHIDLTRATKNTNSGEADVKILATES